MNKKDDGAAKSDSDLTIDVASNVGAIGAGFLLGDPTGLIGGIAGPIISAGLKDFKKRFLGPREEKRIDLAIEYAIQKIRLRVDAGEQLRDDTFFAGGDASQGAESFEGVILSIKEEHEQKKAKFIANIFVQATFDSQLSLARINQMLTLVGQLTYRQLCLLKVFANHDQFPNLMEGNYPISRGDVDPEITSVLTECSSLRSYLLIQVDEGNPAMQPMHKILETIIPGRMNLSVSGRELYQLLELDELPLEDAQEVATLLKMHSSPEDYLVKKAV